MGQTSYKTSETIKYHQYDGTYASFLALNSYFGLDPMNSTWTDTVSQLHITSGAADMYINVNGYGVLYSTGYYTGVDFDSNFRDGYTTDIADLDPKWIADKGSYSTKAVADTLYKDISYVPSWTSITSKPSFAIVATSGAYSDLSGKPTIPTVTGPTANYGYVTVANGLVTGGKRLEMYSGTTNSSGVYTVTFSTAFAVAPNIQVSITNQGSTNQYVRISNISTTGFTINAYSFSTNTLLGIVSLVSTTTNINGATIDVLVTEK